MTIGGIGRKHTDQFANIAPLRGNLGFDSWKMAFEIFV